jgi:hypothetical protein
MQFMGLMILKSSILIASYIIDADAPASEYSEQWCARRIIL